jgi:uncharacterized protein
MEAPTARTQVKRLAELGVYDREVVHAICDEALICHAGYATEDGPRVIPTPDYVTDNRPGDHR